MDGLDASKRARVYFVPDSPVFAGVDAFTGDGFLFQFTKSGTHKMISVPRQGKGGITAIAQALDLRTVYAVFVSADGDWYTAQDMPGVSDKAVEAADKINVLQMHMRWDASVFNMKDQLVVDRLDALISREGFYTVHELTRLDEEQAHADGGRDGAAAAAAAAVSP